METRHKIYISNSQNMQCLGNESIDLIVTSPPYPMIEMWDNIMCSLNPDIENALVNAPSVAFELMHKELDKVWAECFRVLKEGGFMCINIGDATRTINKSFSLYPNHSRIIQSCVGLGLTNLPNIIWRKVTNAPNKFMGSGMLPNGAYVTLEHEWILVFRKGEKRPYKSEIEKSKRRNSAFFWEERNQWFSDLWDLKGVKQNIANSVTRERNASYPLMIPYRLISMYSQEGDTILDPFLGLGTTSIAAMIAGRNSVGVEIDPLLRDAILKNLTTASIDSLNQIIFNRLLAHQDFVEHRISEGKEVKYNNVMSNCRVMTKQEQEIAFHYLMSVKCDNRSDDIVCCYEETPANGELTIKSGIFSFQ